MLDDAFYISCFLSTDDLHQHNGDTLGISSREAIGVGSSSSSSSVNRDLFEATWIHEKNIKHARSQGFDVAHIVMQRDMHTGALRTTSSCSALLLLLMGSACRIHTKHIFQDIYNIQENQQASLKGGKLESTVYFSTIAASSSAVAGACSRYLSS